MMISAVAVLRLQAAKAQSCAKTGAQAELLRCSGSLQGV